MKSLEEFTYLPFNEALIPKEGWGFRCIKDNWWFVHPKKGLVFWINRVPQCNRNKGDLEKLAKVYPKEFKIKFMPIVYFWRP